MSHQLTGWIDSILGTGTSPRCGRAAWVPSADIYRMENGWLVKLDLAGVLPEDVRVAVDGNRLCIAGTRRDRVREQGMTFYRMEISYSTFERVIELPTRLDEAAIETQFCDGLLLIRIQTGSGQASTSD